MRSYVHVLLGLILCTTADAGAATRPADAAPTNEMCPVMPTERATLDHSATYMGKTIYLCCGRCEKKFAAQPEVYLSGLLKASPAATQASPLPSAPPPAPQITKKDRAIAVLSEAAPFLLALVGIVGFHAGTHWLSRRRATSRQPEPPAVAPMSCRSLVPALLVIAGGAGIVRYALDLQGAREAAAVASRSAAAAEHDLGILSHFAGEMTRQGLEQGPDLTGSLSPTYYRGNDERNTKLVNGGYYRTCTFYVSLRDAQGKALKPGDDVTSRELFVCLELERAPFTAEGFYKDEVINNVALLAYPTLPLAPPGSTGAGPSVMRLSALQPGWRWEARYPIGRLDSGRTGDLAGVVLVCPDYDPNSRERTWRAAHYGIQYQLRTEDGRLTASSRLWMSSLYFSIMRSDRQRDEWFSFRPIPVMPTQNTNDPKMLGLDKLKASQHH